MNNKGFTLIELLAVLVILGVLLTLVIPSVFSMIKKGKDNSYNLLIDSFEENTKLYVSRHKTDVFNFLDQNNYFEVKLMDLKDDNLLKTPVLDPRTNEPIDLTKKVIVTREINKTLDICYEDRDCYLPIILGNLLTTPTNIVTGSTEGLHQDTVNNFYYYQGANPNNWVEFNNYLWRIIKINNDGSIKVIFEGKKGKNKTIENGSIGNYKFDANNTNNYDNALIKNRLQVWLNENITTDTQTILLNNQLCKGATTYSTSGTTKETFLSDECLSSTGSNFYVGFLTAKDYLYGSTDSNCTTAYKTAADYGVACKNNNYLYKSNYSYWTVSPTSTSTDVWDVKNTGSLGIPVAANTLSGTRPVVVLKAGILTNRGNGTFANPYKVKDTVKTDTTKPVITLNGSSTVELYLGDSYIDAGATATDDIDGNLTSSIIKTSNLNTNILGEYQTIYIVSDKSGNKAMIVRNIRVVESIDYIASEGVNKPRLASGMTAIKWNGSAWDTVANPDTDTSWYDYASQEWANAKTADGSYWVWIPRYAYQISSGYHTSTTGTINVKFLMNTTNTTSDSTTIYEDNASNTHFVLHPAFDFGGIDLTGIWVAKFEMSGTTSALDSKPNIASLRNQTLGAMFIATRNMEKTNRYGWSQENGTLNTSTGLFSTNGNNVDTHMMKNTEWGAIAYLSQSQYGKYGNSAYNGADKEIFKNPSAGYITGRGGNTVSQSSTTDASGSASATLYGYDGRSCSSKTGYECTGTSQSIYGMASSTTGTIYGIYDISGSADEAIMGNLIEIEYLEGSSEISDESLINDKYIDRYVEYSDMMYGDAVFETSSSSSSSTSWYSDFSLIPFDEYPWFIRGGTHTDGLIAGAFSFSNSDGGTNGNTSWRAIVLVGDGL